MRRKMKLWRGLTAVTGILLCLSILMTDLLVEWSGQVNVVLGVTIPTTVVDGDKWVYPSEYGMNEEGLAAMLAARIAETCFFIGCSPFVCKRKRPHRVFRYGISQRSFCRWSLRCHCSSSLMIVSSICFGV